MVLVPEPSLPRAPFEFAALVREERMLRSIFARVLAAGVAPALVACGGSQVVSADASAGAGDASIEHRVGDGAGGGTLFGDAPFDAYVAWCEAGPPRVTVPGPCTTTVEVPCGLPGGFVISGAGMIDRPDCAKVCPLDAGPLQGCDIVAFDGSYAGGPVAVDCDLCTSGRRPPGLRGRHAKHAAGSVGEWLARAAWLETAAIVAFRELGDELRALGAPRGLVVAALACADDEVRHARVMRKLAWKRRSAVPIVELARRRRRSLPSVAVENAVEGCVRETYGALLAHWQASHAVERDVARAMAVIADDETRHAALGWAIGRWAEESMTKAARRRVRRARNEALASLRRGAGLEAAASVARAVGLPTAAECRALVDGLARAGQWPT